MHGGAHAQLASFGVADERQVQMTTFAEHAWLAADEENSTIVDVCIQVDRPAPSAADRACRDDGWGSVGCVMRVRRVRVQAANLGPMAVTLVAVVDFSGSMAGAKLRRVKDTLNYMIENLSDQVPGFSVASARLFVPSVAIPQDIFGLVGFHTTVWTVFPAGRYILRLRPSAWPVLPQPAAGSTLHTALRIPFCSCTCR